MKKIFGLIGFIWGFVGVSLILLHGITCVYPYVVTLDFSKMFWYHYLSLIISIIFLIIIIERISEPWRGIIDTGVLVGLSWGLLSFWFFCLKPID